MAVYTGAEAAGNPSKLVTFEITLIGMKRFQFAELPFSRDQGTRRARTTAPVVLMAQVKERLRRDVPRLIRITGEKRDLFKVGTKLQIHFDPLFD